MTNNQNVVKITTDPYEASFAYNLKIFDEWPVIFAKSHKIVIADEFSIMWKDYAIKPDIELNGNLLAFLGEQVWINDIRRKPSKLSDETYQKVFETKPSSRDEKLNQDFGKEYLKLAMSHKLDNADLKEENVALSREGDRIVIFDYGHCTIEPFFYPAYYHMNKIIDLA